MAKSIYTPAYRRLCRLLVTARQQASLTQEEVASQLGKPQSFVSKVEIGERRLDVVEFLELCHALDIDPVSSVEEINRVFLKK